MSEMMRSVRTLPANVRPNIFSPTRSEGRAIYGESAEGATFVIDKNYLNFNLRDMLIKYGWTGIERISATVIVKETAILGSASTSLYAFDTGTPYPTGSKLTLINYGFIVGAGGLGGWSVAQNTAGQAGGPAFRAQFLIDVYNYNTIGGGGGGGGGRYVYVPPANCVCDCYGGCP